MLRPALIAAGHWPRAMELKAVCKLTMEEEQAVSTGTEGPRRPKV